ncbi:MAG: LysR family transcriptional regulator [Bradyrhizobium sp.]|nr:MAG: LysR family transcriptional regulator [Bradyrhizobium sp.]
MNLRDLAYVVAVADHGHFGRAALACNVSQPTLSGQILKLEAELGVRIFEREGRSVSVAARAAPIVEQARRAVAAIADVAAAARGARDPMAGPLRIGVIPTIGPYLLPYALPAVIRDLPQAPVTVVEDLTDRLLALTLERKIDAALIATDPGDRKLDCIALYEEPFLLVVAPDHPLAGRASVAPREIDPQTLLLLADGHCLRDQAIALCGRGAGARLAGSDISATSLETLLHLAAAGYGVTLAPRLALDGRGGARLAAVPLSAGARPRQVALAFRRDTTRREAIAKFAASVRSSAPLWLSEPKRSPRRKRT